MAKDVEYFLMCLSAILDSSVEGSLFMSMDKENVVHLHSGVLHSRKINNIILNYTGKWMKLENIILNEVTQTQKDNYHICSLISGF